MAFGSLKVALSLRDALVHNTSTSASFEQMTIGVSITFPQFCE